MKKIITIGTVITTLAGLPAFGQGYFQFMAGKSQVWDCLDWTPSFSTEINTAFLWAPDGSIPAVSSIMLSSPTNGLSMFSISTVWTAILTDPNFVLGVNNDNGQTAIGRTFFNGAIGYNSGYAFPVAGTSPGDSYTVFMIGWDGAYATPELAQAATAGVGWSAAFSYTATAQTSIPNSFVGRTPGFGVWGVPEPSTLALAGLGGFALWLFRRRK